MSRILHTFLSENEVSELSNFTFIKNNNVQLQSFSFYLASHPEHSSQLTPSLELIQDADYKTDHINELLAFLFRPEDGVLAVITSDHAAVAVASRFTGPEITAVRPRLKIPLYSYALFSHYNSLSTPLTLPLAPRIAISDLLKGRTAAAAAAAPSPLGHTPAGITYAAGAQLESLDVVCPDVFAAASRGAAVPPLPPGTTPAGGAGGAGTGAKGKYKARQLAQAATGADPAMCVHPRDPSTVSFVVAGHAQAPELAQVRAAGAAAGAALEGVTGRRVTNLGLDCLMPVCRVVAVLTNDLLDACLAVRQPLTNLDIFMAIFAPEVENTLIKLVNLFSQPLLGVSVAFSATLAHTTTLAQALVLALGGTLCRRPQPPLDPRQPCLQAFNDLPERAPADCQLLLVRNNGSLPAGATTREFMKVQSREPYFITIDWLLFTVFLLPLCAPGLRAPAPYPAASTHAPQLSPLLTVARPSSATRSLHPACAWVPMGRVAAANAVVVRRAGDLAGVGVGDTQKLVPLLSPVVFTVLTEDSLLTMINDGLDISALPTLPLPARPTLPLGAPLTAKLCAALVGKPPFTLTLPKTLDSLATVVWFSVLMASTDFKVVFTDQAGGKIVVGSQGGRKVTLKHDFGKIVENTCIFSLGDIAEFTGGLEKEVAERRLLAILATRPRTGISSILEEVPQAGAARAPKPSYLEDF